MTLSLVDIEAEIKRRHIEKWYLESTVNLYKDAFIISGYGSVSVTDREGHLITIPALKTAVNEFMKNPNYRNLCIFHSDVQVGEIIPYWIHPITGKVYRTQVDNVGWQIVARIRNDLEIARKVREEIEKGNIRSFSVAGTAKNKQKDYNSIQPHENITDLELYECSLCVDGVNALAKFSVIYNN